MARNENPETPEINGTLSKLENTNCQRLRDQETPEKIPIWCLSTIYLSSIYKTITFKRPVLNICHKGNSQTKALLLITKFLNLEQVQVLVEAYISSNFRYSPLIQMFCGKICDNLIVKTHYKTLSAIYYRQTRSHKD